MNGLFIRNGAGLNPAKSDVMVYLARPILAFTISFTMLPLSAYSATASSASGTQTLLTTPIGEDSSLRDELADFFAADAAVNSGGVNAGPLSFLPSSSPTTLPVVRDLNFNPLKGYTKWTFGKSFCDECAIKIIPKNSLLMTNEVYFFLSTLADAKYELQELYDIRGQEYTLLAHMAVGILGRESLFFTSRRYVVKEKMPALVSLAKKIKSFAEGRTVTSSNSRGPTQIKIVPIKIAQRYGIEPVDLKDPNKAALATMGFLIESYQNLRRQVRLKNLTHVTRNRIVDYLPYIYFGAARAIYKKTAIPEKNAYVQDMKKYMTWVDVYELNRQH